jgi:hypothetical protein
LLSLPRSLASFLPFFSSYLFSFWVRVSLCSSSRPQTHKCWDYRCTPPHPTFFPIFTKHLNDFSFNTIFSVYARLQAWWWGQPRTGHGSSLSLEDPPLAACSPSTSLAHHLDGQNRTLCAYTLTPSSATLLWSRTF